MRRRPRSTYSGKEQVPDGATPLSVMLEAMNDECLPAKERHRIAKKLAPYFHPKLKPASGPVDMNLIVGDFEGEAESEAADHDRWVRQTLFNVEDW